MKKKKMWKGLSICVAFSLLMTSGCGVTMEGTGETVDTAQTAEETAQELTETKEDNAVAPRAQDDYYGYVNYDTLQEMDISYGSGSAGPFIDVMNQINEELDAIIDQVVQGDGNYEPGSDEQLVYDAYWMTVNGVDEKVYATEVLKEPIDQIENASSIQELIEVTGKLRKEYAVDFMHSISVDSDIYDGTKNALSMGQLSSALDVSMEDIFEDRDMCESVKNKSQDFLCGLGVEKEEADDRSDDIVYLMLDVASETDMSLKYADYAYDYVKFMTTSELDEMLSNVSIEEIEKSAFITNPYGGWYVYDAGQLQAIDRLLDEEHLQAWKDYCVCELMNTYSSFFADDFLSRYNKTGFMRPDELGKESVKQYLDEELGELYAREYYDEELQASAEAFCQSIIESYSQVILECTWLSEEGKKNMVEKLENITFFIGAPAEHEIDPKDADLIGKNGYETFKNLIERKEDELYAMIGEPAKESSFLMSPQTVNACYNTDNTVTLPFGIMHAPFYDKNADFYTNLGGLGMVLCHEISHAFDSDCIAFDMNGNYRPDWISEPDRNAFEEKMQRASDYYDNYTIMEVYHIDGELTLGENFADLGAMECLMKMTNNAEERKLIFENYAKIWCDLAISKYAIESLALDPHSPSLVRVNAVLSSCDEFYEVYDVKEGDGMYVAPEERVSRW